MQYNNLHDWNLSPKEAIRLQYKLKERLIFKGLALSSLKYIAGVDVSVKNDLSKAAIVVLSYPSLEIIEFETHTEKTCFPYVPGLLSFREAPVILKCARKLQKEPDLFVFDGQGRAHPRGMGIASHLGLFLEKPTIGSAKSRLYGTYDEPASSKGSYSILKDKDGSHLGAALRTRRRRKVIFVSPGHLIDIPSSIELIMKCSPKYKLPIPVREAHKAASLKF